MDAAIELAKRQLPSSPNLETPFTVVMANYGAGSRPTGMAVRSGIRI